MQNSAIIFNRINNDKSEIENVNIPTLPSPPLTLVFSNVEETTKKKITAIRRLDNIRYRRFPVEFSTGARFLVENSSTGTKQKQKKKKHGDVAAGILRSISIRKNLDAILLTTRRWFSSEVLQVMAARH